MNDCHYFLDKQMKQEATVKPKTSKRGTVNTVFWKIGKKDKDIIQVIVEGDISHHVTNVKDKEMTTLFLGNFEECLKN